MIEFTKFTNKTWQPNKNKQFGTISYNSDLNKAKLFFRIQIQCKCKRKFKITLILGYKVYSYWYPSITKRGFTSNEKVEI